MVSYANDMVHKALLICSEKYGFDRTEALRLVGVIENNEMPVDEFERDYWEQVTEESHQWAIDHKDMTMADWAREDWAGTPLPINIWERYGSRYFSANGPVTADPLLEQLSDLEEGRHFKWREAAKILQQELRDTILTRNYVGWSAINAEIKRTKLEEKGDAILAERDAKIQRMKRCYEEPSDRTCYEEPSDREKLNHYLHQLQYDMCNCNEYFA